MKLTAALLAFALALFAQGARAEPPATPPDPEPWRFTIAPYAWAMGVTGNVTVRNQTIDTNASFIDLLQKSSGTDYLAINEILYGPIIGVRFRF